MSHPNNPVKAKCHPDRPHMARGLCGSCYNIKWLKENPDKADAIWERYKEKNKERIPKLTRAAIYKISVEDYEKLLESANNLCEICHNAKSGKKTLGVDHCHNTGIIRGILCHNCNTGLGHFKDSTELLEAAILYLRKERKVIHGNI